ncbi:hypothetical protein [Streptomyces erythrochromogenes]|uniref:hypothetical protein n=1 Tax=Streptomyces erythrochromogenes TaxID=285574 RepID=UPI00380C9E09|nr:hypothetical protein OG489_02010 [Streptomyces erythrochromogenes]
MTGMIVLDILIGLVILGFLIQLSPYMLGISFIALIISIATWTPQGMLISFIACLVSGGLMVLREPDKIYVIVKR